jgi:hydroxyacylglutathione hydrolase
MFFKRYFAEGLAHYSYMIGDQGRAVVIDPRRDIDEYLQDASREGLHIALVLETHRNEDYLIGSCEIAAATGATLFHADGELPYQYGQAVQDGDHWKIGRLRLEAIHTPGHTLGSMSYLLYDPDGSPWIIFTGDVLFSGDVGRVDLVDVNRREEMAGLLYDSIFEKILPLGDSLIICPAHGAGSVCGSDIAERVWTTVGLEKQLNPKLQAKSREAFIQKNAKILERPPYFRKMEVLNLQGPPVLGQLPYLRPLTPGAFDAAREGAFVLDTRNLLSFGAGHVPGSQFIWEKRLAKFAGWFIQYDQPLLLVDEDRPSPQVLRTLIRMGFDNLAGYLSGGAQSWAAFGKGLNTIKMVDIPQFCDVIKRTPSTPVLDVRGASAPELKGLGRIHHIPLSQLPEMYEDVPQNEHIYVLCRSGVQSMIAASYLQHHGRENLTVVVGGLVGWRNFGCQPKP